MNDTTNLPALIEDENNNKQTVVFTEEELQQIDDDFSKVRDNINDLIESSETALEQITELAKQSQDNKYYDSLVKVIQINLEANKSLIDLHDKKKNIRPAKTSTTINNNLILTTAEFLEMIKNKNAKEF